MKEKEDNKNELLPKEIKQSLMKVEKEYEQRRKIRRFKGLRAFIVFLIILIILVLAIVLAGNYYLNAQYNKINYQEIDLNEIAISTTGVPNNYRNIIILGIDSTQDDLSNDFRTDSIIVLSLNEKTNTVKMFSIYRDTYLKMDLDVVDNKKVSEKQTIFDKVNHAYYDGVENTLKVINTNMDLNISEYVIGNYSTVIDAVEFLDGIELDITKDELKYINGYVESINKSTNHKSPKVTTSGKQKVNGVQACAYCRIRYTEGGDYKRTERMRTVLNKIGEKVRALPLSKINDFLSVVLPDIETNIKVDDIINMVPRALNITIEDSFGWPYETEGIWFDNYGSKDFFGPAKTLESNVKKLHVELFDQSEYEVPDNIVTISNEIIERTGVGKEAQTNEEEGE